MRFKLPTVKQVLFIKFLLLSGIGFTQTFDFDSKTLNVGDIYRPSPKTFFKYNQKTIDSSSFPQLDSLITFLIKHDSLHIKVCGHKDYRGVNPTVRDQTSAGLNQ